MDSRLFAASSLALGLAAVCSLHADHSASRHPHGLRLRRPAEDGFDARYGPRAEDLTFPLVLRIGLQEGQEQARFDAPSDATLRLGDEQVEVPAWTDVTVEVVAPQPATVVYQVALGSYDAARLAEADSEAAGLKAEGVDARLVPWGARLFGEDGRRLHDHRRVFLVVDQSTDREAADALVREWGQRGYRPFLHEQLRASAGATLRARVEGGPTLEGPAPLDFVPAVRRFRVFDVEYGVNEPWHGFETRKYHGVLRFAPNRDGMLATVNAVELETYLKGVVPSEILPSSPHPALRAQAVAARGETLAKYKLRHAPDPFDLCAQTHCQVYGGITKEHARTSAAVDHTEGQVMRLGDHIVDAVYGAVCGGHTESNDLVWTSPPDPALRGRRDGTDGVPSPVTDENIEAFLADTQSAWCKGAAGDKFRWTRRFTGAEVRAFLAAKDMDVGRVLRLETGERGLSGRLRSLTVFGDGGQVTIQKELPIRRTLGNLRSALFVADQERGSDGYLTRVTLRGGGWGHGVGFCQVGARAQAAAGREYRTILKSYYTGIRVDRVDQPGGS